MIDPELKTRVRRLFYAEHWKVGTIAQELGLHHDTVERAIESARFANSASREAKTSILDPYKPFVADTLDRHPKLRASRIFDMIRARGYPGGQAILRRYVHTIRPMPAEAFFALETLPGEQAQVDWASFGKVRIGAATRSLSCFVMTLGYSRGLFGRFVFDQAMESFIRCHVQAFAAFGGVPRVLLYDNLKSVVLERVGDHIRFHPHILELAGYYHFAPRPCAPRRGNEKGKVERAIQYLRHSFFAARKYSSIDDLNQQLDEWIQRVAYARPRPRDPERRSVREALEQERPRLLPQPANAFAASSLRPVASGKTPYIRFDLNDYSIPAALVRQPLTLVATEREVRILDGQVEVARHARSYDRGQRIEDRTHLAELGAEKLHAAELRGRSRLTSVLPSANRLLERVAARDGHLGGTTSRLLRILDREGADEVEAAIQIALERGAASAEAIAAVIEQRRRRRNAMPIVEPALSEQARARDVDVVPHTLSNYDALAGAEKTK